MNREEADALADRIAETAAHIDAATHGLLTDIRVFDASGHWANMGAKSVPHYLSWRIGLGLGTAREKVRVARALGELPLIDEAFRQAKVSYSKVRAMTRVATPENEAKLLNVALSAPAAELEKTCRLLRRVQATDDTKVDRYRRWVSQRETDDGMVSIQLRLRPDEAALVMRAIEQFTPVEGDRADGVVALAEQAVAEQRSPGNANDTGEANDETGTERTMAPATDVMITIDAETLSGETDLGDGVPAETCRRILCDAGLVPAITDEMGHTLDVGRKTRVIPPSIRRAMHRRDKGCRFPGCTTAHVDGHHIEHWIENGETKLGNLVSLCRFHHTALHDGVFSISKEGGELIFRNKWNRIIAPVPARPIGDATRLRGTARAAGLSVDARTLTPNWDGQRPDYGLIVSSLCGGW